MKAIRQMEVNHDPESTGPTIVKNRIVNFPGCRSFWKPARQAARPML